MIDRRVRLELALDLLNGAREIGAVASKTHGERSATLRKWSEKLSARGMALVMDDLQASLEGMREG